MKRTLWILAMGMGLVAVTARAGQAPAPASSTQGNPVVCSKAEQAMAFVLAGDGSGHASLSVGVITRADGVLFTGYHALRGGLEVQVRLHSGETYDQVSMLGFDERRDVAALHVAGRGLAALPGAALDEAAPGDRVLVLTADSAMTWTSSDGVLGPVRLADEVPGAGRGYRVIQFTASLPAGSIGGALLDARGRLLGLLTLPANSAGRQWAIPLESVAGLPAEGRRTALGSGKDLTPPTVVARSGPAQNESASPATALGNAHSLRVTSNTTFFSPFMLEKELMSNARFRALGLNLVNGFRGGDLLVNVDRPLFTYDFTYSVTSAPTGVVLVTGKITAIDGPHAAQGIAQRLVEELENAQGLRTAEPSLKDLSRLM
jgi:S1-C subfamily serine protease